MVCLKSVVICYVGGVEFDLPTGECEERAAAGGTMSCQELLALSGALSAALPTGQVALDSFFEELTKGISKRAGEEKLDTRVSNTMYCTFSILVISHYKSDK